jgi:hypothetical protein
MNKIFELAYYIFSLIYTFKVWGLGWGLIGIVLPIFPLIDLANYLISLMVK